MDYYRRRRRLLKRLGMIVLTCVTFSALSNIVLSINFISRDIPDEIFKYSYLKSDVQTENATHPHTVRNQSIFFNLVRKGERPNSQFFKQKRRVTQVNCAKVFQGDKSETVKALTWSKKLNEHAMDDSRFLQLTKNCDKFIRDRGYIMSPLTEEEQNFSLAYSITLYDNVEQFERLLRAIYRPQNYYCVHVDKKSALSVFTATKAIVSCFPNVYMAPKRVAVIWAEASVLWSNLVCAKELFTRGDRWKYFINLAGQEFPLKTNFQIVRILKSLEGANNIEGVTRKVKLRREFTNKPPHDLRLVKGCLNIAATRGFIEFALFDPIAEDLLDWIGYTDIPDESFFSTLNYNNKLHVPGSPTELTSTDEKQNPYIVRVSNWENAEIFPCKGKFVREICIFGVGDLQFLAKREEMFANKFHLDYQRAGYECLDELIYNQTRDDYMKMRNSQPTRRGPRKFSIYS